MTEAPGALTPSGGVAGAAVMVAPVRPRSLPSVNSTQTPPDAAAFVVLYPDGTSTWHTVDQGAAVEEIVAGPYPGVLARNWLGPACPLRIMASDVSALRPDKFDDNALADRVIRALSDDYISQPWFGPVAVYAHDEGFVEVMPNQWVERITRLLAS